MTSFYLRKVPSKSLSRMVDIGWAKLQTYYQHHSVARSVYIGWHSRIESCGSGQTSKCLFMNIDHSTMWGVGIVSSKGGEVERGLGIVSLYAAVFVETLNLVHADNNIFVVYYTTSFLITWPKRLFNLSEGSFSTYYYGMHSATLFVVLVLGRQHATVLKPCASRTSMDYGAPYCCSRNA